MPYTTSLHHALKPQIILAEFGRTSRAGDKKKKIPFLGKNSSRGKTGLEIVSSEESRDYNIPRL